VHEKLLKYLLMDEVWWIYKIQFELKEKFKAKLIQVSL
jgi:hypothetical protein